MTTSLAELDARHQRDILRRAEYLAGDSFDDRDDQAMEWLQDWSGDRLAMDVLCAAIAQCAGQKADLFLMVQLLRDRYITERRDEYMDRARDELEANGLCPEDLCE